MGSLHARVVKSGDATDLAWVAEPDQVRGAQLAQRHGTQWLPEPDLDSVDAVIVAAPTQFHHAIALQVIGAGKPLLLEKPLADNLAHTRELIDLAEARGSILMCGLLERFSPAVRTACEIAKAPLHVSTVRHSPYAERIRTGVAGDLLIHDVDLVLRLIGGMPTSASCHFGHFEPRSAPDSEDVADAILQFGGGQIASLSASRVAQHKVRTLTISELERVIEVDLLRQVITVYRHVQANEFDEDAGYSQQTIIDIPVMRYLGEPLQLQLQHFVSLIHGTADAHAERAGILSPHVVIDQLTLLARSKPSTATSPNEEPT
ncbi:MAG: gfo/Idh/MocA family oxidoreductase [Actinobacteria bacterium]|nr:gfo/Idh/MocA family oxidoreductase [Actinomycetota bacterium]